MQQGLVTLASPAGPQETLARLLSAVTGRGLRVFATIDHAQASVQAGLEMRPASVVIFGSPKAGTPLMQMAPTLAIDLPLKALVWQDAQGQTWLTYNAATWIARRHSLGTEDIAEEAWESEGGAVDHHTDVLFSPRHNLGPAARPIITAMSEGLAEIARGVCRTDGE
jgi:uncharacterized protein (DUF302 family)